MRRTLRRWLTAAYPSVAVTLVLLGLLELGLRCALAHAEPSSRWIGTYRSFHRYEQMRAIQYLEPCAQWDPRLGYRLRPGACRFEDREFSVEVRVNGLGVRDDERSLLAPTVIVLGDSYAMGWGVEADRSFPSLVEDRLGRPVLNAGISSYGTARELRLLEEIDLSRLQWLVIQYCGNDSVENRAFVEDPDAPTMDEATYRERVRSRRTRDYPGKLLVKLLPRMANDALAELSGHPERTEMARMLASDRPSPREQARDFLTLLARAEHLPPSVRIVVLELRGFGLADDAVIHALARELERPEHAMLRDRITLVELADTLTPEHYFVLDSHIDVDGHRVVADRLCAALGC